MSSLAAYIAGGIAMILAIDTMAPPVGAGFIHGLVASPASFNARFDATNVPSLYDVNRAGKGSRLAPVTSPANTTGTSTFAPKARRPTHEIVRDVDSPVKETSPAATPIGCDPAYSTLSRAAPLRFTGRCVV